MSVNRRGFLRGVLGTAALGVFGWRSVEVEPEIEEGWRRPTVAERIEGYLQAHHEGIEVFEFTGASWVRVGDRLWFKGANGKLYVQDAASGTARLA